MRIMRWMGLLAPVLLAIAAFLPWVVIESRQMTITGVDTAGTNYGKPAYVHFILLSLYLVFHLVPRLWAKRANLVVVALNTAWAIRNFFLLAVCRSGECPSRKAGLYLMLLASLLMLVAALFPRTEDIKGTGEQ